MEKAFVWLVRLAASAAVIVGGLSFAYESRWFLGCDIPENNAPGFVLQTWGECLLQIGGPGVWLDKVLVEVAEVHWYADHYETAPLVLFLAGILVLVLAFRPSIYTQKRWMILSLLALFVITIWGFTEIEWFPKTGDWADLTAVWYTHLPWFDWNFIAWFDHSPWYFAIDSWWTITPPSWLR